MGDSCTVGYPMSPIFKTASVRRHAAEDTWVRRAQVSLILWQQSYLQQIFQL